MNDYKFDARCIGIKFVIDKMVIRDECSSELVVMK